MYNFIIIGGGAAGLFCSLYLPKTSKKLILEKTKSLGTKLLLSGGGRCNFSNARIDPLQDYFGQNKKALPSLFHAFGSEDMRSLLETNGIQTQEEDNGRLILKSGKAQELTNFLIQKSKENLTEHLLEQAIVSITKNGDHFVIKTNDGEFEAEKVIIATGGKSFPQVGASDFGLQIAKQFGLEVVEPIPGLGGIETKENVSELTGNSIACSLELFHQSKSIFQTTGNLLFTHRGISGPTIFNTSNALAEYCNKKQIGISDLNNFAIVTHPQLSTTIKKIVNHFNLGEANNSFMLNLKAFRAWEEAKVMNGGIHMKEINPTMESKKVPGLYFIGEVLDITGKTGGYNLQRCWTSAYACAKKNI